MKPLFTLAIILFSLAAIAQTSPAPKGAGTAGQNAMTIDVPLSVQQDLEAIQKAAEEISQPDYVKKQLAILNDRYNVILSTAIKMYADPATIDSTRYEGGKIILKLKPQKK